jgi:hypothetical protein
VGSFEGLEHGVGESLFAAAQVFDRCQRRRHVCRNARCPRPQRRIWVTTRRPRTVRMTRTRAERCLAVPPTGGRQMRAPWTSRSTAVMTLSNGSRLRAVPTWELLRGSCAPLYAPQSARDDGDRCEPMCTRPPPNPLPTRAFAHHRQSTVSLRWKSAGSGFELATPSPHRLSSRRAVKVRVPPRTLFSTPRRAGVIDTPPTCSRLSPWNR